MTISNCLPIFDASNCQAERECPQRKKTKVGDKQFNKLDIPIDGDGDDDDVDLHQVDANDHQVNELGL